MKIETVTAERISLWTEDCSCAELDYMPAGCDLSDLGVELEPPVFWFCRLKAKVEGQGEGTRLMRRLVEILDNKRITVVNAVNPYGCMDMEQLKVFYAKYGFEDIGNDVMIRRPQGETNEAANDNT